MNIRASHASHFQMHILMEMSTKCGIGYVFYYEIVKNKCQQKCMCLQYVLMSIPFILCSNEVSVA